MRLLCSVRIIINTTRQRKQQQRQQQQQRRQQQMINTSAVAAAYVALRRSGFGAGAAVTATVTGTGTATATATTTTTTTTMTTATTTTTTNSRVQARVQARVQGVHAQWAQEVHSSRRVPGWSAGHVGLEGMRLKVHGLGGSKGPGRSRVQEGSGSRVQNSSPKLKGPQARRGTKFKGPQARGVQSSRVHGPDLSKAQARARGPNGPIDPNLNQGNLGPRASWLQNARAQEESAGPLDPTGPHHHANLLAVFSRADCGALPIIVSSVFVFRGSAAVGACLGWLT
jgi:hypothetical protein